MLFRFIMYNELNIRALNLILKLYIRAFFSTWVNLDSNLMNEFKTCTS
jgi:hypothetical protein